MEFMKRRTFLVSTGAVLGTSMASGIVSADEEEDRVVGGGAPSTDDCAVTYAIEGVDDFDTFTLDIEEALLFPKEYGGNGDASDGPFAEDPEENRVDVISGDTIELCDVPAGEYSQVHLNISDIDAGKDDVSLPGKSTFKINESFTVDEDEETRFTVTVRFQQRESGYVLQPVPKAVQSFKQAD